MRIYEINKAYAELEAMAENEEITPKCVRDTVEYLGLELEDAADETAKHIKNNKSLIAGVNSEIDRLKRRKEALEKLNGALKGYLEETMIRADKKKFKTLLFSFNIQKNQESLKIDDSEKAMENGYILNKPEVDKERLKADLKKGKKVDFAHLEQSESLRIR